MREKFLLIAGLTVLLVACGTKVPLKEPAQVESRDTQAPTLPSNNGNGARDVKTVNVTSDAVDVMNHVVYFDFDSYVIKPEFQALLAAQAKHLMGNRAVKISLAGHTDDLGGREYNLALGQKRADAVKRALAILGVTEAQMEAVSFGKEKPAVAGTDDTARAKNRRVEISVQ